MNRNTLVIGLVVIAGALAAVWPVVTGLLVFLVPALVILIFLIAGFVSDERRNISMPPSVQAEVYTDEHPKWVQDVHAYQRRTFGSGNGRIDRED